MKWSRSEEGKGILRCYFVNFFIVWNFWRKKKKLSFILEEKGFNLKWLDFKELFVVNSIFGLLGWKDFEG